MVTGVGVAVRSDEQVDASVARAFRMRPVAVVVTLTLLLVATVASVATGAAGLPVSGVIRSLATQLPGLELAGSLDPAQEAILFSIRVPRTLLALLVGAALGMAGAAYQGVFRNPLADPYLLGVSAGAGLGAVLTLGFGLDVGWGPVRALPMAAFAGGVLAVACSAVVSRGSFAHPPTLLLSGVAMAALFSATQTFALHKLDPDRAREVLSWLFGSLAADGWDPVLLLLPYVVVCFAILTAYGRHLDVLRVEDDEARTLGLNPARVRLVVIGVATLVTAAAVAVSGLIAFVGVVVPHVVRLLAGHSYRIIVPLSAVVGGTFLVGTDMLARTVVAPAELPVGIIAAFVGAPFFGYVLWRGTRADR